MKCQILFLEKKIRKLGNNLHEMSMPISLFLPESRHWHFMKIVLGKLKKKKYFKILSAAILPSTLSVKI